MRRALIGAAALGVALAGFAAWVRFAEDDPAVWHVEPLAGPHGGAPNVFLVSPEPVERLDAGRQMRGPGFGVPPERLARAVDAAALAEPDTVLLAGSVAEGHMTYVQRSAIMRFPDYISVRVLADGEGSALAMLSRSRYGYSDLGVNEARLRRWLAAIEAQLAE